MNWRYIGDVLEMYWRCDRKSIGLGWCDVTMGFGDDLRKIWLIILHFAR